MSEIFATSYFKNFIVPFATIFLCVFLKIVSRNDRYKTFKNEDLAIGLELAITALIIFIVDSINSAMQLKSLSGLRELKAIEEQLNNKLMNVPWILLVFFFLIWFISTLIRKVGWKNDSELKWICGIILPDILGVSLLVFVVNWAG